MGNTITDFVFDDKKLSDFGYMLCVFDNASTETKPVSEITFNTFKAPKSDKWIKISNKYNDPLTTTLQICKKNCNNENDEFYITDDDMSEIVKWLCRKQYKQFRLLDYKYNDVYFEAQINVEKIVFGDNIIGLELNVQTNRPYGLTDLYDLDFSTNENNKFSITVDTDEEGILYPDIVTIKCLENGDLSFTNEFDNSNTTIENCVSGEVITFDCKTLQITSNIDTHDIYNGFNYTYPHLCSMYENYKNDFVCNIKAKINVKYRGIRKVGL